MSDIAKRIRIRRTERAVGSGWHQKDGISPTLRDSLRYSEHHRGEIVEEERVQNADVKN
jgi:hypothetical protein